MKKILLLVLVLLFALPLAIADDLTMNKLFTIKIDYGIVYVVATDFAQAEKIFTKHKDYQDTEIKGIEFVSSNILLTSNQ